MTRYYLLASRIAQWLIGLALLAIIGLGTATSDETTWTLMSIVCITLLIAATLTFAMYLIAWGLWEVLSRVCRFLLERR